MKLFIRFSIIFLLISPVVAIAQEDLKRDSFNIKKSFTGVQQQQGRMTTDSDTNEASSITKKPKAKLKKQPELNRDSDKSKKLKPIKSDKS